MFTFAQNFGLQFPNRDAQLKGNQVILPQPLQRRGVKGN